MPIDSWNNAPPLLTEWIGRNELIIQITNDWQDSRKRVTGLIGFGGEANPVLLGNGLTLSSDPMLDVRHVMVYFGGVSMKTVL